MKPERWADVCILIGAALLVWALMGYEVTTGKPRLTLDGEIYPVSGGYSDTERATAVVGAALIGAGVIVKLRSR